MWVLHYKTLIQRGDYFGRRQQLAEGQARAFNWRHNQDQNTSYTFTNCYNETYYFVHYKLCIYITGT